MIGFQIKLNSLSKLDLTFSHGTAYVCLQQYIDTVSSIGYICGGDLRPLEERPS
jgi:hypothetical protein